MNPADASWREGLTAVMDELRDFDWNDLRRVETIGAWPAAVMLLLGLALFAICLGAGYCLDIRHLRASVQQLGAEEARLRAELHRQAALAAELPARRGQMAEMEASFAALLLQLPGHSEVPALLEDISAIGLGSGLRFASIQLQTELEQAYYLELPIDIEVAGGYHDFGRFVSGVASLARIVTLHDFSIQAGEGELLTMTIAARTYRYRPETER